MNVKSLSGVRLSRPHRRAEWGGGRVEGQRAGQDRGLAGGQGQGRILGCEKHSQGVCKSRERKLMCKGGNRDKGEGSRSC